MKVFQFLLEFRDFTYSHPSKIQVLCGSFLFMKYLQNIEYMYYMSFIAILTLVEYMQSLLHL